MPNKFSMPRHKISLLTGLLLASAALNLFLVGVLAGAVPGSKHRGFPPMALAFHHGAPWVDGMTRTLDPPDAKVFHEAVQAQTEALQQAQDQVRQATKDVAAAFEKDPASLQIAFDHWGEAKANADLVVKKIIEDAQVKLSPEGRRRLAEMTR